MADDRIDVEVTDKIDGSIPTKLLAIATNADKGATSVQRLKAELASITDTPTTRLKAATDGINNSLAKELDAQRTLTTTAGTATAALDKEAQAQDRISKMIDASIAKYQLQRQAAQDAYNAAVARSSGAGLAGAAQGAGGAVAAVEGAALGAGVAEATKETERAAVELEATTLPIFARFKQAAVNTFDTVRDAIAFNAGRFKGFFGSGGAATMATEASGIEKVGKAAAVNSVAIRELFVIAREGSRGNFSRMAGSVSILAQSLGLLYTVLIPVVLVLGTAAAALAIFQHNMNENGAPERLKNYADTLGLTSKEMRKLGDETVSADGKIKTFNAIKITWADTFHGFVQTVKDGLSGMGDNMEATTNKMGISWSTLWGDIKTIAYNAFLGFFASVRTLVDWIETTFTNVWTILQNTVQIIGNSTVLFIQTAVNKAIDFINTLSSGANAVLSALGLSTVIPQIGQIDTGIHGILQGVKGLAGIDLHGSFVANLQEGKKTIEGFGAALAHNEEQAARDRLKRMADDIIANRNPKKGRTSDPKTKDDFLDDENKKLDMQLSRMSMLKDAREAQQQLDTIEEEFQKRRMPLNDIEIAQFKKKIDAIAAYKFVQAELDRIYEEAVSPLRTYNATVAAATDLFNRHAISAARLAFELEQAKSKLDASKDLIGANEALRTYNDNIAKATLSLAEGGITATQYAEAIARLKREYQQAIDPLFTMNETVVSGMTAARAYGVEVERVNYLEQIRQAYAAKGKSIIDANTGALTAEVAELVKKNDALRQQTYIQSQVSAIVNPILDYNRTIANKKAMYAEIDRLRQTDVLKENEAAQAKRALDAKFAEMRLNDASTFFGDLASLSSSGNKKLAAIGKAAAVAQATIDGYVAVQKALASTAPPWNFAIAAAVAIKTGAQVAGILSTNVGNFATGGDFIVEGRGGVDTNNINMNVSRGERIKIETPQQQRDADKNKGSSVTVPVKVVNIHDPSEIPSAMDSDAGERVIMNIIKRNARGVGALIRQ